MAIYFIRAGMDGPIKIGLSDDPIARLRGLQTGHHETLMILGVLPGWLDTERKLHHQMRASKIRNEWFSPTKEVLDLVATSSMAISEVLSSAQEIEERSRSRSQEPRKSYGAVSSKTVKKINQHDIAATLKRVQEASSAVAKRLGYSRNEMREHAEKLIVLPRKKRFF